MKQARQTPVADQADNLLVRPRGRIAALILTGVAVANGLLGLVWYAPVWVLAAVLVLSTTALILEWRARQDTQSPSNDHLERSSSVSDDTAGSDEGSGRAALVALGRDLFPIWQRHVESVRTQSEEAIVALTREFTQLNSELRGAVEVFESLDVDDSGLGAVLVR